MKFDKHKFCFCFVVILFAAISFTCKNKKPVRKLIGEWEVINSTLTLKSSSTLLNSEAKLGTISLLRSKAAGDNSYFNNGVWNFIDFPDSVIPSSGSLLWTSVDKDNYVRVPWRIQIIFSNEITKGDPNRGGDYFNCYQGYLNVTEIKGRKHYRIEGDIFKPRNNPNRPEYPLYKWVFELKEK